MQAQCLCVNSAAATRGESSKSQESDRARSGNGADIDRSIGCVFERDLGDHPVCAVDCRAHHEASPTVVGEAVCRGELEAEVVRGVELPVARGGADGDRARAIEIGRASCRERV